MAHYLRITNRNPDSARGYFPRRLLRVVGASTKRIGKNGELQRGQFGTGKKYAAAAALRLVMEVHIASHDAEGPYGYSYGTCKPADGGDPQIIMRAFGGSGPDQMLELDAGVAKNWHEPIGDDTVTCIHVLREYLSDAVDADPSGVQLQPDCTVIAPAPAASTVVYLTMTDEVRHVLAHLDRYFKFLSDVPPMYVVPKIGAIYPKAEAGMTRIFARGSIAYCTRAEADDSQFDYSFEAKSLVSGDRTFRSMTDVRRHLLELLVRVDDVHLASQLLRGMLIGRYGLEASSLALLADKPNIPAAACWLAAWQRLYPGSEAVLTSFHHVYDEYARNQGKQVVTVNAAGVIKLLVNVGVKYASAYFPHTDSNYRVVAPDALQQRHLDASLSTLRRWGLTHPDYDTRIYELRAQRPYQKPDMGFCILAGGAKGVYVHAAVAHDEQEALETVYHEHVHARTGAADGSHAFDDQKDRDVARLLLVIECLLDRFRRDGADVAAVLVEVEEALREPDAIEIGFDQHTLTQP